MDSACTCSVQISCCDRVVSGRDGQTDVNVSWIGHISETFVGTKTHKRLKERFLIGRNMTKREHFRGSPLFQATYKIKTGKQTINSTYLLSVGSGRLAEGNGHEADWRDKEKGVSQLCFRFVCWHHYWVAMPVKNRFKNVGQCWKQGYRLRHCTNDCAFNYGSKIQSLRGNENRGRSWIYLHCIFLYIYIFFFYTPLPA